MSAEQLERLAAGIKAAHAAGNEDHVRKLGAEYRRLQAASNAPAQQEEDTSHMSTVKGGLDQITEGVADTAQVLGFEGIERFLRGIVETPENYKGAAEAFINEGGDGYNWSSLPRATLEQAPQYAGSMAARGAGALAGSAFGPLGTLAGAAVGPAAFEASQIFGPTVKERARRNGREDDPSFTDYAVGGLTAAASGALNSIGLGGKTLPGKIGKEFLTEGAQSGVEQVGSTAGTEEGFEFSGKQALGEGILGGTSAGAVNSVGVAAGQVKESVEGIRTDNENFTEADVIAANELVKAAGGNPDEVDTMEFAKRILSNVDEDEGDDNAKSAANTAIRSLRAQYERIANNVKALAKAEDNRDALETLNIMGKVKSHTKSRPSDQYLNDLYNQMPHVSESVNKMGHLLEAMSKLGRFTSGSVNDMGGLTQYTRLFDITDKRNNLKFAAIGTGILSGGTGFVAGTSSNRLARKIDRLTNRRSRIKRYVDSVGKHAPDLKILDGNAARDALKVIKEDQALLKESEQAAALEAKWERERASELTKVENARKKLMDVQNKDSLRDIKKNARADAQAQSQAVKVSEAEMNEELFLKAAFDTKGEMPRTRMYEGWRLWEHHVGAKIGPIAETMASLEKNGSIPEGTTERFRTNPNSFGKKDPITLPLQEMIRQQLGTQPKKEPFVSYKTEMMKTPAQVDDLLKKVQSQLPTTKKGRKKYLEEVGQMRALKLQLEIENEVENLPAKKYGPLLSLARTINSPEFTAEERFQMVDDSLNSIFRLKVERELWKKKFYPLAAHGNAYKIEREQTPKQVEQKKVDAAVDKHIDEVAKAANANKAPKKKKDKKKKGNEAEKRQIEKTPATEQLELDLKPAEEPAEAALAKLKETPQDEPEEVPSPATKAVKDKEPAFDEAREAVKKEKPAKAKTEKVKTTEPKGNRRGLADRIDERIEDIEAALEIWDTDAEGFLEMVSKLDKSPEQRVLKSIYEQTSARVTMNQLADSYAKRHKIPPEHAVKIVDNVLKDMEKAGKIKLFVPKGNSKLKVDGEVKYEEGGGYLNVIEVKFLDPDLKQNIETAQAINMVNRMVDQDEPDSLYRPDMLREGPHKALKDYGDRVHASFQPLLDFLNDMRQMKHSIHPDILTQIEAALDQSKEDKKRSTGLTEILNPVTQVIPTKTGNKRRIRDEGPFRTVAQMLWMLGRGDERTHTEFRQEWQAGANGRIYSKNSLMHSQSGDIMKGMIRAQEPAPIVSESSLDFMFHSFGNLLGFDKKSPFERRQSIFQDGLADELVKFAEQPFGRNVMKTSRDKETKIAQIVRDGEGFFQVLNAAHEVKSMVDHAKERFPKKAKMTAVELLQDPEVREDLVKSYQTDFIVQLDASNNAYQLAGMLMGYEDVLRATGLLPPQGAEGDPDRRQGADIYLDPARSIAERIPELYRLFKDPEGDQLSESKLRKLFKKPIGTYLYAAEYESRRDAFRAVLEDIAGDAPIVGVNGEPGLIQMDQTMFDNLTSETGHVFEKNKYDVETDEVKTTHTRRRILQDANGKFRVESDDSVRGGKWKVGKARYDTAEDAAAHIYELDIYGRMNRELVRDIRLRYPMMAEYLGYANTVAQIMKERGKEAVTVISKDGIPLEYQFKQSVSYTGVDVDLGGDTPVRLGVATPNYKLKGRGLAAFMAHQSDAYVLREAYKRLKAGGIHTFNPIHDSFGFHPADAQRGQQIVLEVMQELGDPNYNIFLEILEANGITIEEFRAAGGVLPDRKGVAPVPVNQIPTALS